MNGYSADESNHESVYTSQNIFFVCFFLLHTFVVPRLLVVSSFLLGITPNYYVTNLVDVYIHVHTLVNYSFLIHYSFTFASEIDILCFSWR